MIRDIKEYDKSVWECARHMLDKDINDNVLKIVEDISDNTLNEIIIVLSKEKAYQEKLLEYRLSIHDDPKILDDTEDKSKFDEIYEYIRNQDKIFNTEGEL
jgi:tetrahydromethanopterin S-methyltransferase subunit H